MADPKNKIPATPADIFPIAHYDLDNEYVMNEAELIEEVWRNRDGLKVQDALEQNICWNCRQHFHENVHRSFADNYPGGYYSSKHFLISRLTGLCEYCVDGATGKRTLLPHEEPILPINPLNMPLQQVDEGTASAHNKNAPVPAPPDPVPTSALTLTFPPMADSEDLDEEE